MIEYIEEAYQLVTGYTSKTLRPGLMDLLTFDMLVDMNMQDDEYVWFNTPDEVMQHIVDNNVTFTLQFGLEDLWHAIREYLIENDFVKSIDDVKEEEENNDN